MKQHIKNAMEIRSKIRFSLLMAFSLIAIVGKAQTAWVAPKDADNNKNPTAGNAALITEAKALYTANCGPCHGDKGRGDGPAAQGLNPKPADHTSAAVQAESDGALFWKLSEGRNPMPAYKKIFSDQQRWELVSYIRTLAKKKK